MSILKLEKNLSRKEILETFGKEKLIDYALNMMELALSTQELTEDILKDINELKGKEEVLIYSLDGFNTLQIPHLIEELIENELTVLIDIRASKLTVTKASFGDNCKNLKN